MRNRGGSIGVFCFSRRHIDPRGGSTGARRHAARRQTRATHAPPGHPARGRLFRHGRSPGSQVVTAFRPSRCAGASVTQSESGSLLTVAGAAPDLPKKAHRLPFSLPTPGGIGRTITPTVGIHRTLEVNILFQRRTETIAWIIRKVALGMALRRARDLLQNGENPFIIALSDIETQEPAGRA